MTVSKIKQAEVASWNALQLQKSHVHRMATNAYTHEYIHGIGSGEAKPS